MRRRIAHDGLEIGYWTHSSFLRQGVATEVVRLLTDTVLARPELTHVEIQHDKANVATAGIPSKLGFRFVGEERDEPEVPADLGIECRWMDKGAWLSQ